MSDIKRRAEPFACAPGLRLEAHERVSKLQLDALADRLERLNAVIERMERRLWLTVYGVAAVILATVFKDFLGAMPVLQ